MSSVRSDASPFQSGRLSNDSSSRLSITNSPYEYDITGNLPCSSSHQDSESLSLGGVTAQLERAQLSSSRQSSADESQSPGRFSKFPRPRGARSQDRAHSRTFLRARRSDSEGRQSGASTPNGQSPGSHDSRSRDIRRASDPVRCAQDGGSATTTNAFSSFQTLQRAHSLSGVKPLPVPPSMKRLSRRSDSTQNFMSSHSSIATDFSSLRSSEEGDLSNNNPDDDSIFPDEVKQFLEQEFSQQPQAEAADSTVPDFSPQSADLLSPASQQQHTPQSTTLKDCMKEDTALSPESCMQKDAPSPYCLLSQRSSTNQLVDTGIQSQPSDPVSLQPTPSPINNVQHSPQPPRKADLGYRPEMYNNMAVAPMNVLQQQEQAAAAAAAAQGPNPGYQNYNMPGPMGYNNGMPPQQVPFHNGGHCNNPQMMGGYGQPPYPGQYNNWGQPNMPNQDPRYLMQQQQAGMNPMSGFQGGQYPGMYPGGGVQQGEWSVNQQRQSPQVQVPQISQSQFSRRQQHQGGNRTGMQNQFRHPHPPTPEEQGNMTPGMGPVQQPRPYHYPQNQSGGMSMNNGQATAMMGEQNNYGAVPGASGYGGQIPQQQYQQPAMGQQGYPICADAGQGSMDRPSCQHAAPPQRNLLGVQMSPPCTQAAPSQRSLLGVQMSPPCTQVSSTSDVKAKARQQQESHQHQPQQQQQQQLGGDFMAGINSISTDNLIDNLSSISMEGLPAPTGPALSPTMLLKPPPQGNSGNPPGWEQGSTREGRGTLLDTSNMVVNDLNSSLTQMVEENRFFSMR